MPYINRTTLLYIHDNCGNNTIIWKSIYFLQKLQVQWSYLYQIHLGSTCISTNRCLYQTWFRLSMAIISKLLACPNVNYERIKATTGICFSYKLKLKKIIFGIFSSSIVIWYLISNLNTFCLSLRWPWLQFRQFALSYMQLLIHPFDILPN